MKLLAKQNKAVYYLKDSDTTELLYGGAAGGGKSALGCLWLIESCQRFEGSRWLMGRSKLKTLKETTLNTFFDLCSELGISDQYVYNGQTNTILWNNGSSIVLKDLFLYPSDPNFDSLGSLEICGGFIDECNQIVYKAWQVSKSRMRYKLLDYCDKCGSQHKQNVLKTEIIEGVEVITQWICDNNHTSNGLKPMIFGTCNPAKNWVYKKFYIADKNESLPSYRRFIQALPTDNPHLPESYLQSLRELDEASKQRLYYGNWEFDDDKATIISFNAIMDYWNGKHVERNGKMYLTIDVARKGKDKTVFRVWDGFVCIHREELSKSLVTEVADRAKELQAEYKIKNSNTVADEDGVGGGVVDILNCQGFINNSKAKLKENYDNLKSQCSIRMAKRIERGEVVEICKDQTVIDRVSEEMEQVKYKDVDKDGKQGIIPKDKVKEMIGRSPDDWDTIMMREIFDIYGDFVMV